MRRILKFLFLPILSIGLYVYVYQSSLSPKLGLDLQGGISVILTADQNTDPEVLEKSVEIMRTRIEAFGDVQEPEISISCLLYTSPSPRDLSTSRMPSSA